jgi:DNA polymerase III gamma/tau subunit
LLHRVCDAEGKPIVKEAKDLIAAKCNGSPRMALTMLEKVIDLPLDQQLQAAQQTVQEESQIIDLCHALRDSKKWIEVSKILQGLQDKDPEQVRLAVLGYFNKVLLSNTPSQHERAYLIIDSFKESFYYIGKAGLTKACYEALLK